jgi:hypothetical protein
MGVLRATIAQKSKIRKIHPALNTYAARTEVVSAILVYNMYRYSCATLLIWLKLMIQK